MDVMCQRIRGRKGPRLKVAVARAPTGECATAGGFGRAIAALAVPYPAICISCRVKIRIRVCPAGAGVRRKGVRDARVGGLRWISETSVPLLMQAEVMHWP